MAVVLTWEEARKSFRESQIFAGPTDTIFGLQAAATPSNLERLRVLKGKIDNKLITLVSSIEMAQSLCEVSAEHRTLLQQYWPGAITFVLPTSKGTLAVRWPNHPELCALIKESGNPLLSTSCNTHGAAPVKTLTEAVHLFGDRIDFYVEGSALLDQPSTLVDLTSPTPVVLRHGAVRFPA